MLNSYERHVMAGYLSNMANRFHRESPEAHGVVEWLTENADLPGLDRRSLELESESFDSKERMSAKQWRVCRRMLDDVVKDTVATRPDRLTRRLCRLGRVIRLSGEEISILQFLLRYQTQPEFEDLVDTVANGRHRRFHRSALNLKSRLPSSALGVSASTLRRRLATDAPLVRSGLVYVDDDQDISSLERLRLLVWEGGRHMDIRKLLLGATRTTALEWSDFDHLGQNRNDVESLLLGARESGKKGVNVLIHGPPGTGKTEFCRVLAKRMGAELFSVGEADAAGGEPTRRKRWSGLFRQVEGEAKIVSDWFFALVEAVSSGMSGSPSTPSRQALESLAWGCRALRAGSGATGAQGTAPRNAGGQPAAIGR